MLYLLIFPQCGREIGSHFRWNCSSRLPPLGLHGLSVLLGPALGLCSLDPRL
jgi:hypothetical protein